MNEGGKEALIAHSFIHSRKSIEQRARGLRYLGVVKAARCVAAPPNRQVF